MFAPHRAATPSEQHSAMARAGQCRQASFNARAKFFIASHRLRAGPCRTARVVVIANCPGRERSIHPQRGAAV